MNHQKLFVSDLDGTLLCDKGLLSVESRRRLQTLINKGLNFTVASARSLHTISDVLQDLKLPLPVICLNGAYISDYNTKKHLFINGIQQEIRRDIQAYIEEHTLGVFTSTHYNGKDYLYYNRLNNGGLQWYHEDRTSGNDTRLRRMTFPGELKNHHVLCFTFIDREENLLRIEEELLKKNEDKVEVHIFENFYSKDWYWLTVHDCRATKDRAIKQIQEEFGHRDKELIVFGDHINDIKMFRIANRCIAVQNADERLKKYAHEIIGTNTENSVVNYLDSMFR